MRRPAIIIGLCLGLIWPAQAQTGKRIILLAGNKLWTPLNLGSSLIAWWDAQYLPNLTFNGSNISAWADRKAGIVASQGTGANQPGWSATARNGKSGLTFGVNNFMLFTATGFPTGASIGSLFAAAYTTSGGAGQGIVGYGTNASLQWRMIQVSSNNVAGTLFAGDIVSSTSGSNVDRFAEYLIGASSQSLVIDGGTPQTISRVPNTSGTTGAIGGNVPSGASTVTGTIQQLLVLNVIPSTCQQQKLEGWESWYDGKAGANLPSNHPYKSAAPIAGGAC